MKKTIYPILAFSGLLAMSCSNDTETGVAGDTRLVVDLGTDLSFSTSGEPAPAKRAIDESAYTDIRNYTVTLTKTANGEQVHTALYSEWALAYQVEPGIEYTLTASYGEEAPASYDNLLVSGSETFSVQPGATKVVDFQCKPKAAKVNVVYSSDFTDFYSDCEVSIQTKYMDEAMTMSMANVGQDLYLKADAEGEEVTLTFNVKDKNGDPIAVDGLTTTRTVIVTPQTLLKLTFKPDVTEIEGGKFGLDITVDTGVTEENVDIVIPNTVFE